MKTCRIPYENPVVQGSATSLLNNLLPYRPSWHISMTIQPTRLGQLSKPLLVQSTLFLFSLSHAGSIDTDIKRNWSGWLQNLSPIISFLFLKNPQDGAQTTIHCAVADDMEKHSGSYFKGCRVQNLLGRATDDELANRLWDVSLKMTKLSSESKLL